MPKEIENFADDHHCLCCGVDNPDGLKMKFIFEGEYLFSVTAIPKKFQGFSNVVHGGVLGTLLDEMMVNYLWLRGEKCVTAEYEVRLKAPCPVDRNVLLKAWMIEERRGIHRMGSEARLEDGTLVAEGTAKCLRVR